MAKAKVNRKKEMVMVEQETGVIESITLELSLEEAIMIKALVGMAGGTLLQNHTNTVYGALHEAGLNDTYGIKLGMDNITLKNELEASIYFDQAVGNLRDKLEGYRQGFTKTGCKPAWRDLTAKGLIVIISI